MSNYAWVCFGCRTAARRPGSASDVKCRVCGSPCECIGYKTPIPPKTKVKAWDELCSEYYTARRTALIRESRSRVARRHSIEREISRLEALPSSKGRATAVVELRKKLQTIGA
jgi:hypothetical protein